MYKLYSFIIGWGAIVAVALSFITYTLATVLLYCAITSTYLDTRESANIVLGISVAITATDCLFCWLQSDKK